MKPVKKFISARFMETFTRIHNKVNELDRKLQLQISKDLVLNSGEIDTIVSIGNHPKANITELAQFNGVSKAAISKMVKKLAGKGFVERKKMIGNQKEVILELTDLGESVMEIRNDHHQHFFQMIEDRVGIYSVEQIDILLELMKLIEDHVDEHLSE